MPNTITFNLAAAASAQRSPFANHMRVWLLRRKYRAQLREMIVMGPELIADFGMTMEQAERETDLPFWKSGRETVLRPLY